MPRHFSARTSSSPASTVQSRASDAGSSGSSSSSSDHDRHHHHSRASPQYPHSRRRAHGPRQRALPAPDEERAVVVRGDQPVQAVPRAHHDDWSEDDEEDVYNCRPRPVSRRDSGRHPERRRDHRAGSRRKGDQGFLLAAAMVMMSLVVCCVEADP